MKKLLSLLLAAALLIAVIGVIPASAENTEALADTGADVEEIADTSAEADHLAGTGGMPDWVKSSFVCGDYECYEDLDGNARIYAYTGSEEAVVIPPALNGHTVVGLYWGAFQNKDMTSVEIPETVWIIESDVFRNCKKLETVNIPDAVTRIGDNAFNGCELLMDLTIPDAVTEVGTDAFKDTLWLTLQPNGVVYAGKVAYCYQGSVPATVTIKAGTVTLSPRIFIDKDDLKTVNLPSSLRTIGYDAFKDCDGLETIDIPNGVTSIGTSAFEGCDALTAVTLPASVSELGERVFHYCGSLTSLTVDPANPVYDSRGNCNAVIRSADNTLLMATYHSTIPNGVETIGRDAFMSSYHETELVIPDSVRVIDSQAFWGCYNLETVRFPAHLEKIGGGAFAYCYELSDVQIPDTITHLARNAFAGTQWEKNLPAGMVYFGKVAFGYIYHNNDERPAALTIREGTQYIAEEAFRDQWSVKTVSLPDSLLEIGNSAFNECSGLTSVKIPEGVTTIGDSAFANCSALTTANVPAAATSLGWDIFSNDGNLKDVTLAEGLTAIPNWMFNNCSGLESIDLPASLTEIGQSAFQDCTSLTTFTVPDAVTRIKYYAFSGCSALKTLRLGTGLTEMAGTAFNQCKFTYIFIKDIQTYWSFLFPLSDLSITHLYLNNKLVTELTLPGNITAIPDKAFYKWEDLKKITLHDALVSIGKEAFEDCDGLLELIVPDSVTQVGEYAFGYCDKLQSLTIGAAMTDFDRNIIYRCDKLTTLKVSKANPRFDSRFNCNAVVETGTDTIFLGCPGATIPDSVTTIGESAFENCKGLKELRIPNTVTTIGARAFERSGLTHITIPESVKNIGEYAFNVCEDLKDYAFADRSVNIIQLVNAQVGRYYYWESHWDYNNNCIVVTKHEGKYSGITIYGFDGSGSNPKTFANTYGFDFKPWSERPADPPEIHLTILGDANEDGDVTVVDVTTIQRHLAGLSIKTIDMTAADADGDKEVTVIDATLIQRKLATIPQPYPIGDPIA